MALVTIGVGVMGLVDPDRGTALRRLYFATSNRQHAAAAVRLAMGLVVMAAAVDCRWPRCVGALGALMCLQALSATLMGRERAQTVLDWESGHTALLRAGAAGALAIGCFMALALVGPPPGQERTIL